MYIYIYSSSMAAATPATIESSITNTSPNLDKLRCVTWLICV